MNEDTFVSVVMNAYNEEKYVATAVRSILEQTHREFQLIIIDDASQDATPDILQDLAASDSRIEVYRNPENQGIARSANNGLAHARGTLVARMDADDIALPERLRAQVEAFARRPELILCGTAMIRMDAAGRPKALGEWPTDRDVMRWYAIFRPPVQQSSAMFRIDPASDQPRYEERLTPADDFGMWSQLIRQGEVEVLPTPLIRYREHTQNATHTRWKVMARAAAVICRDNLLHAAPAFFAEHGESAATSIANLVERNAPRDAEDIGHSIELLFAVESHYLASLNASPQRTRYAIQQLTMRWLIQALASPDVAPRGRRLKAALALRGRFPRLAAEAVDYLKKRIKAKRFQVPPIATGSPLPGNPDAKLR